MKTAISVPDEVFEHVEQLARQRHTSRSAIFTAAVKEYVAHHRQDVVTEQLNAVYGTEDSTLDPMLSRMQTASLPVERWT